MERPWGRALWAGFVLAMLIWGVAEASAADQTKQSRSSFVALAANTSSNKSIRRELTQRKIATLVQDYDRLQAIQVLKTMALPQPLPEEPNTPVPGPRPPGEPPQQVCPPSGNFPQDCVDAVCSQLGHFACDEQNEVAEVSRLCRNVSGACVRSVCNRVNRFDCDEISELNIVTNICRGLRDASCIDYVCSRLSRFECDELAEIQQVARQCR